MMRLGLTLLARGVVAGGGVTLRPARGVWALTVRAERGGRRRVTRATGRATLACVDAALGSPHTDAAVQRIVDSPLTERAVARALSGGLVDVVALDLVRHRVVERVVDRFDAAGVPQLVADRLLVDGIVERFAERILDAPELRRMVDEAAAERPGDGRYRVST